MDSCTRTIHGHVRFVWYDSTSQSEFQLHSLDQWFSNFFCHPPPLHRRTKMPAPPFSNERQNDGNVKCPKNCLILQSQTV